MAVGANQCIGIGNFGAAGFLCGRPDTAGQVFHVHLVANACARGHNAEVIKCGLAPAQEFIAFPIALKFKIHIFLECIRTAEIIHHDGMVDYQITGR